MHLHDKLIAVMELPSALELQYKREKRHRDQIIVHGSEASSSMLACPVGGPTARGAYMYGYGVQTGAHFLSHDDNLAMATISERAKKSRWGLHSDVKRFPG